MGRGLVIPPRAPSALLRAPPWAGEPNALCCQENQFPSLLWNLREFLEKREGGWECECMNVCVCGCASGVGVCLCA
jgi:hypothetical protein